MAAVGVGPPICFTWEDVGLHGIGWVRRYRAPMLLVLLGLVGVGAGCAPQMQWRGFAFEPVYTESRRQSKLTLVFLRNWYSIECTEFEEQVLSDPDVIAAARMINCVKVEESTPVDSALALAWGVDVTPGVVIIAPDGKVLAALQGEITKTELLKAIADAERAHPGPARPPAKTATSQ